MPVALEVLNNPAQSGISVARWAEYRKSVERGENGSKLHIFIGNVGPTPPGCGFPRPAWVRVNRLRIRVGLSRSKMHKWDMDSTAACECGVKEQTAEHVITSCPIYHHPN